MEARIFFLKVKKEANLPDLKSAENVTAAVLSTLHSRLQEGEAQNIEATLPTEIKELWRGEFSERIAKKMGAVEKLHKSQFVARVQDKARLRTTQEAERITRAVLRVLKEAIPGGEIEDVSAQLPQDLKEFWKAA